MEMGEERVLASKVTWFENMEVQRLEPMPITIGMQTKARTNVLMSFVSDASARATSSQRPYSPDDAAKLRASAAP